MNTAAVAALAATAAVFVALYAAHQVADHWIQTDHQACTKGQPGWPGRIACAAHVTTYTLTGLTALALLAGVTGWRPDPWALVAGMAVSAVSHYVADRRTPLRWLADALGKDPRWLTHGGGLYALDQSWHVGFLFLSALLVSA